MYSTELFGRDAVWVLSWRAASSLWERRLGGEALKRIIYPDRKIKILISPSPVGISVIKQIFPGDIGDLPAIVFCDIGAFKSEAHVKTYEEVTKVEPQTRACRKPKLFVNVFKLELCTVKAAVRLGIFKIPDIACINKKCTL